MSYENYDDVRSQLMDAGLLLDGEIKIGGGKSARCRVEGRGKEKRGWYWLHEAAIDGKYYLIGAYGVYEGADPGTQKIKLTKRCDDCKREIPAKERKCPHCGGKVKRNDLTPEQKESHRARIAEDEKLERARAQAAADRAARRADRAWQRCSTDGSCEYLTRKKITEHGARYTTRGNLVIPMQDPLGRIHGLQVIYGDPAVKRRKERDKDFWPAGCAVAGHFYMVGSPGPVILLCEGFATMASLLQATLTLPVAMVFSAGNLLPVARVLHKRYRNARILICADDDYASRVGFANDGTPILNPGVTLAELAALEVGGAWVAPVFALDTARADIAAQIDFTAADYKAQVGKVLAGRRKLTDFNDLHDTEGLHLVGAQINAKIEELGWNASTPARVTQAEGGGVRELTPITSTQELFDRFAIVYGHNEALFDFQERMLVSIKDMKAACSGRETWRDWMESQEKKIVRIENVGFDPGGEDPAITCNLWGGWPAEEAKGECGLILEMLEYMCSKEKSPKELYLWVLRWLAYPIRHAGAKMKTALIFHGWQGVGKNLFFEIIMSIYGKYGRIIDQSALEDKHNDTFSKKLFFIADEVIARQELYHVKGKIKGLITGEWIRINPKNVGAYHERNHVNLVFLSNEILPIILDRDDRRFVVVWTPQQLSAEWYKNIRAEVDGGGAAALHHFLKHELDMGDFTPWTRPPMTEAKRDLIEISMDSTERFWIEWSKGRIDPVPVLPVKSMQLYAFYREWCARSGYARYAPETKFLAEIGKRTDGKKQQARYLNGTGEKMATFIFPPGIDQPVDKSQAIWLGETVNEFAECVTQWREEGSLRN